MKNFALAIIVMICTTATVNAQNDITLDNASAVFVNKVIFPGYNAAYVVKESERVTVKKTPKNAYTTIVAGPDGKPVVVDATPSIGDEVLEFEIKPDNGKKQKVSWYNISTKQLLVQQKIQSSIQGGKQSTGSTKEPRQKGTGPTLGQGVQVLGGIYQAVTGRRTFGGSNQGLGNGPVDGDGLQ